MCAPSARTVKITYVLVQGRAIFSIAQSNGKALNVQRVLRESGVNTALRPVLLIVGLTTAQRMLACAHHVLMDFIMTSAMTHVQPTVLKTCAIKRAVSAHIIAAQDSLEILV